MSAWLLFQIAVNLGLVLSVFALWHQFRKPPQEDPRLSKGLQLLQSKIAILEDLSDRTEVQVKQLTALMASKAKEFHEKMQEADQHIREVEKSIQKSLEVSKIFQDKIPHQEIIERQTTAKYVEAARLAHQGLSVEEISAQLDIPRGELELIVRMNRERLVFNERDLPSWIADNPRLSTEAEVAATRFDSQTVQGFESLRQAMASAALAPTTFDEQLRNEVEASMSSAEKILNEQMIQEQSMRVTLSGATPAQAPQPQQYSRTQIAATKATESQTKSPDKKEVRPYQFQRIQIKT